MRTPPCASAPSTKLPPMKPAPPVTSRVLIRSGSIEKAGLTGLAYPSGRRGRRRIGAARGRTSARQPRLVGADFSRDRSERHARQQRRVAVVLAFEPRIGNMAHLQHAACPLPAERRDELVVRT